jgi:hypothetical protein
MWGYLSEFWNAITGVSLDAWNYTAEFFQSIGNAVAGALGGAFDWLWHNVNDFFIFAGWVLTQVKTLFIIFTAPLSYFYSFVKGFSGSVFKPPVEIPAILNVYSTSTLQIFNAIPYWDTMTAMLGVALLLVGAGGVIYLLMKI